jgi:hypothetical protein
MPALPPRPVEVAWAIMLGGAAIAATNTLAIMLTVAWPGLDLRGLHLVFDAVETLGLSACFAAPFVLLAAAEARRARALPDLPIWSPLSVACVATMYSTLGMHLSRQAHAVFDGRAAAVLFPLYVVLCGLAIPAALILGAGLARMGRRGPQLGAGLALGGIVTGHAILRDDYPGVHFAILWTSMCLFGASVAHRLMPKLARLRSLPLVLAGVILGVGSLSIAPPNAVRLELFREPGAVAGWLLARHRWSPPAIPAASLAASAAASAHGSRAARTVTCVARCRRGLPRHPVVVLITIDAMRGDLLRDHKLDRRWPNFASLRDAGAYFPRAIAPGSQTSVSLSSLFAVRYFSQLRWAPHGVGSQRFLYPAADTSRRFPELLADAGVSTHSVIGLIFLAGRYGIARGFADETLVVRSREHASAERVMRPLIGRLGRVEAGRSAFFYAHLMEPHEPYDRGKLKEGSAYERYLSEIEVVDHWLARVWRLLRRRYGGRGYLIISSDHGEAFGEHGTTFHTKTLYDELLSVPLVFWGPGIDRGVRTDRVSLIDVGPTVLDLFGVQAAPGMMGASLLATLRRMGPVPKRPLIAEGRLRRALYHDDGLKVIEDGVRKTVEVYDISRDPKEARNLFDTERARVAPAVAALRQRYQQILLRDGGYEPPYKP